MLVTHDGFTTVTAPPPAAWYLNGEIDPMKPLCLDAGLRLAGKEIQVLPEEKWVRPMRLVASGSIGCIPWSQTMPRGRYMSFVKNLINSITGSMDDIPKDYYRTAWCPGGQLLASLKAAKVDPVLYRELSGSIERDSGAFETFRPGPGGFLPVVKYDRFATRTGRLTVESGPNILTLKKEYRRILKSHYSDGVICSLDFSALEARIILAEAGRHSSAVDLYQHLATELFGGSVPRNDVKVAVISELYGSSRAAIGLRLGIGGSKLNNFVDVVESYFDMPNLKRRLKTENSVSGTIKNKHGRLLQIQDPQDHLLVNTYAQSTGVDVSLLGFKTVIDRLGTDGIRPLFVLHDALILDVRNDRLPDVESVSSVAVPGYDTEFPLKFEKV
jgi:hypothetical protein